MKILGITGGSNVGKTFITSLFTNIDNLEKFKLNEIPLIFNADKTLADLYSKNKFVIDKISKLYPEAVVDGKVDKKKLTTFYFASDENAKKVENASIDEVKKAVDDFIKKNQDKNICLLDMPMLVNLGFHKKCDFVILVTADYNIRLKRAIKRMYEQKGYNRDKAIKIFEDIVKKQSGLNKLTRKNITTEEAAKIGDEFKRSKLKEDKIPYYELENSSHKPFDDLISEIEKNILRKII